MAQIKRATQRRTGTYRGDNVEMLEKLMGTQREYRWLRRSVFASLSEQFDIQVSEVHRVLGMVRYAAQEIGDAERLINNHEANKSALIQILLDIQEERGWLSKSVLMYVSHRLGVPFSQVYHTVTFYKAFSLAPQGRQIVSVCLGTDCQTRKASRLLEKVIKVLKIEPGQTSKDMKFSLFAEDCLGCCAIGPVMVVDDKYYTNPSIMEIRRIIAACE